MAQNAGVGGILPDIVLDTKLESDVYANYTVHHVFDALTQSPGVRPRKTTERWDRGRELGSGGFGTVWLENCTSGRSKGKLRAVKEIRCRVPDGATPSSECVRELEAIGKFSQAPYRRCFVQSFGWYETDSTVFVAMEYMEHGDLQDFMTRPLATEDAIHITKQILEGIAFMHSFSFTHRDLKPRNILVQTPGPSWWVKIADFGITKRVHEATGLTTVVGTPAYMAPEIQGIYPLADFNAGLQSKEYTSAVDIWAIGAMAFHIVTGRPAFSIPQDLFTYVVMGMPLKFLDDFGPEDEFRNFIEKVMAASARLRISAQEALQHPWIQLNQEYHESTAESAAEHPAPAVSPTSPDAWFDLPTDVRRDLEEQPSAAWTNTVQPLAPTIVPIRRSQPKRDPTLPPAIDHQLLYKRRNTRKELNYNVQFTVFTDSGRNIFLLGQQYTGADSQPQNPVASKSEVIVELRDSTTFTLIKRAVLSNSTPQHMECLRGSDEDCVFSVLSPVNGRNSQAVHCGGDITSVTEVYAVWQFELLGISPHKHALLYDTTEKMTYVERLGQGSAPADQLKTIFQLPKNKRFVKKWQDANIWYWATFSHDGTIVVGARHSLNSSGLRWSRIHKKPTRDLIDADGWLAVVWDVETGAVKHILEDTSTFHPQGIIAISSNNKIVVGASASALDSIKVWHISDDPAALRKEELKPSRRGDMAEILQACQLSRDGALVVSSSRLVAPDQPSTWFTYRSPFQHEIRVWDVFSGTIRQTLQYGPEFFVHSIRSLDISADGRTIMATARRGEEFYKSEVIMWELQ
ncbi:kinase-like domain-containing protein [Cercophora newfieldiana]|uniref:Autophagy-related protein 1 n=1 Tax=Cercophora newfieldiana TaxID=92897 RepID=A0AA39YDT4_9PEZI|nr:kinase-like domain-containing protein [Cercophora newfieldiana]